MCWSTGPLDLVHSIESILSHVHKSSREPTGYICTGMCAHVVVYEIIRQSDYNVCIIITVNLQQQQRMVEIPLSKVDVQSPKVKTL